MKKFTAEADDSIPYDMTIPFSRKNGLSDNANDLLSKIEQISYSPYERSNNPFDEDYDECKNPFAECYTSNEEN